MRTKNETGTTTTHAPAVLISTAEARPVHRRSVSANDLPGTTTTRPTGAATSGRSNGDVSHDADKERDGHDDDARAVGGNFDGGDAEGGLLGALRSLLPSSDSLGRRAMSRSDFEVDFDVDIEGYNNCHENDEDDDDCMACGGRSVSSHSRRQEQQQQPQQDYMAGVGPSTSFIPGVSNNSDHCNNRNSNRHSINRGRSNGVGQYLTMNRRFDQKWWGENRIKIRRQRRRMEHRQVIKVVAGQRMAEEGLEVAVEM